MNRMTNRMTLTLTVELNQDLLDALRLSVQAQQQGAARDDQPAYDVRLDAIDNDEPMADDVADFVLNRAGFGMIQVGRDGHGEGSMWAESD